MPDSVFRTAGGGIRKDDADYQELIRLDVREVYQHSYDRLDSVVFIDEG